MGRLLFRFLKRWWRPIRAVVGLALVGVAVWFVAGKTSELSGASAFLVQLRWYWLGFAGAVELASYLSMSSLQRALLRAGKTFVPLRRVALMTFAGSALQSALPVGAAFAGLYYFRQYELFGADDVLAGWGVVATGLSSFATLAGLAGVGLALAASTGTAFDLVEAIVGVLVIALAAGIAWNQRALLYRLAVDAAKWAEERFRRPPGQFTEPLARGIKRMRAVAPNPRGWATVLSWGAASWLFDCACLMFAFLAVGAGVPWQGLLLAYCAGQLAVNLPITPGGLGVVEGSLTVALVAFGGGKAATVAAVLLYRVISFWIPLPVGGACYVALNRLWARQPRPALVTTELRALPEPSANGGGERAGGEPVVARGGEVLHVQKVRRAHVRNKR
jgi:uncharacterized membrane protein YbhN (UPF0104 family)